jgi:hypothetical protein
MTNLPATFIEAEAVDTIVGWIDVVREKLTSDAARRALREHIRERLFRQEAIPRMQVIAAAEAGNRDADLALRELATEYISRRVEMPTELANYVQRALMHPPVSDPPGRNIADTWSRDIVIAILVQLTMVTWGVPATRSHHSKKSGRLSACRLVAVALGRRKHNLTERRVEKIFADHDGKLVERLSATIPPI